MALRKLSLNEWRPFLDQMTHEPSSKWAELEIASLDLGNQIVARDMRLLGIVYDARNDLLEINLDAIDHLVFKPREIFVDGPPVATVAVRSDDGALQIVHLREPVLLPSHSR
jgi:hypothetical protein